MNSKIHTKIELFDSTLREGAQTPYVNYSFEQKRELISDLTELGIDFIEVGYPASSSKEFYEICALTAIKPRAQLSVLGRSVQRDILKGNETQAEVLDIDLGVSPNQLKYLKITLDEAFKMAHQITSFATKTNKRIKFAALDFVRTSYKDLLTLYEIVSKCGAEWFTLCDTVGLANPNQVKYYVKKLRSISGCKLSVHFHNDFDMATANTITAAQVGVEQLELTINGLGDRAGIAPMAPVVTYLQEIAGVPLGLDLTKLKSLSEKVSRFTKLPIFPLEPIVGKYCFVHNPGIHIAGVLKDTTTFEPFNPSKIGSKRDFVIGRYTGKHAIERVLSAHNIQITSEKLVGLTEIIKERIVKNNKNLTTAEIIKLAGELLG